MFGFAVILFLVSPIAFLAGLINPRWVLLGENRTRLKSSVLYSGAFVASLVIAGLTAPPQSKNTSTPSPSVAASVSPSVAPPPDVANSPSQPPEKTVATEEATNWSGELCQGDRYFPANGASLAVWNSCQYIKSDSLKPETIVLATTKDSENVAESMIDKGFKKVSWKDDFNPLTNRSTSACIVYKDKSVACHKGESSNRSSNEEKESTVQTASSTPIAIATFPPVQRVDSLKFFL